MGLLESSRMIRKLYVIPLQSSSFTIDIQSIDYCKLQL